MKNIERALSVISGHAVLLASLLVLVSIGVTLIQSATRPFWNDEYFTLAVAEQASAGEMMKALDQGVDLSPPLFHLITRLTTRAAGMNRVGLRLPAVVGFAVMMLGIYFFVSRALPGATGRVSGVVAMMLPVLTGLEYYASEARGYGLMLGFVTLSLLCWQASRNSWLLSSLAGLMLACAVLSHSYAFFVLGPLLLAEWIRSYMRRRGNWNFILVPVFAIASVLPALIQGRKAAALHAEVPRASSADLLGFYSLLFGSMGVEIALLLALFAALWFLGEPAPSANPEADLATEPDIAAYVALGGSLLLLPLVVVPLSAIAKLLFTFRYSVSSGIGLSLVFAYLIFLLHRWRAASLPVALAVVLLGFGFHETEILLRFARNPYPVPDRPSFEDPEAKTLPVVAQDPYLYVEMISTWPSEKIANLQFVLDKGMAHQLVGQTIAEVNIAQLAPVKPMKLETYAELLRDRKQFLLYYDTAVNRDEIKGWLLKKLLDDGIPMQLLRRHGDILVYLVTIPG